MVPNRRNAGFTLIELLIVIIIIGILAAIAIPVFLSQRDRAKDSTVKSGIHQIELGIGSYALDLDDVYPPVAAVVPDIDGESNLNPDPALRTVGDWVNPWPENPWTGAPMQHVVAPSRGDFTYVPIGVPPQTFTLTGHLSDGDSFVVP